MRDLPSSTRSYEEWMARYTRPLALGLRLKHQRMCESPFAFFRATFYRWAEHARRWRRDDRRRASAVPAIADLHIENFGTLRVAEGRLIWGVNDFDETCVLPWTDDLVRLVTSVLLATDADHLGVGRKAAVRAVWEGYRDGIRGGGRPFVLEEEHDWLRAIALSDARAPAAFWRRIQAYALASPAEARTVAPHLLRPPLSAARVRIVRRIAGLGSLGRPRLVAFGACQGGLVAREAKALVPSASHWAAGLDPSLVDAAADYRRTVDAAVRTPDPFLRVQGGWTVRRLAPHCTRVELTDLPALRDELRLLHAFGAETANVHLGSPRARPRIMRELRTFDADWLRAKAKLGLETVMDEFRSWRRAARPVRTAVR
jgi:hypothetical protein